MTENFPPYRGLPDTSFEAQYKRVFEAAECRTQVESAALLEVKQSSVSDAKRRKSVPSEWLVKLFEKKQINPDWIRCGTSAKYLAPVDSEQNRLHVVRVTEVKPPQECSAQELFNELVRRALQETDIAALRQAVADSWPPVNEMNAKS